VNVADSKPQPRARAFGGWVSFLRGVAASLTWRKFLLAEAVGLALNLVRDVEYPKLAAMPHFKIDNAIVTAFGAAGVLLAVLCADEAVRRGVRTSLAYWIALLTASAATGAVQWYTRVWFGLTPAMDPAAHTLVQLTQMGITALDVMLFGGSAALVYLNRRSAARALEAVRAAELKRVQIERRVIESRMAAAQAQVDPRMLFEALAEIQEGYRTSSADADGRLDQLIHQLQASSARRVDSASAGGHRP
jgi:hypothetical protein